MSSQNGKGESDVKIVVNAKDIFRVSTFRRGWKNFS